MSTFEDLKISKSVLKAIEKLGLTEPTPIQEKAIPMIRSGVDVPGIAQTGTGKTAAFLITLIMKLVKAEAQIPIRGGATKSSNSTRLFWLKVRPTLKKP